MEELLCRKRRDAVVFSPFPPSCTGELLLYFSLPALKRQWRGGKAEELLCRKRRDAVALLID